MLLFNILEEITMGTKCKNSAILRNCWISVRGAIKLHPFGMHAKEVQFYCPSSTYPASEAQVARGCSIVKLHNKVLIIATVCTMYMWLHDYMKIEG